MEVDDSALIQFFKNCVISNEKELILKKLSETVALRQALIKKSSTTFHELFGFYFGDPSIVIVFIEILTQIRYIVIVMFFVFTHRF